jgi:hypothetical protein
MKRKKPHCRHPFFPHSLCYCFENMHTTFLSPLLIRKKKNCSVLLKFSQEKQKEKKRESYSSLFIQNFCFLPNKGNKRDNENSLVFTFIMCGKCTAFVSSSLSVPFVADNLQTCCRVSSFPSTLFLTMRRKAVRTCDLFSDHRDLIYLHTASR